MVLFEKAKQQLVLSTKRFQDLVPGHRSHKVPATWDDVQAAVLAVQSQWEAKSKDSHIGQAREWFRKMCNGMNNHSTALKMLPSDSEYVSLIAGSVAMIIKVRAPMAMPTEEITYSKADVDRPPPTTSISPNPLPRALLTSMTLFILNT